MLVVPATADVPAEEPPELEPEVALPPVAAPALPPPPAPEGATSAQAAVSVRAEQKTNWWGLSHMTGSFALNAHKAAQFPLFL